nr:MAG TPA: hypothetical protein [Caudoviricetes sp.]
MPRGCSVRAFCKQVASRLQALCKQVASTLQAFADVLLAICMLAYFGLRTWLKDRRN